MSSLFFREKGIGPPLVFIHGFCETHEIWNDFIDPFTTDFRVLTPDLPGFGKSEMLPTPFTIDDVGDAVARWLTELQISNALIIGHSLGGYVTLSLAALHPELVRGFGLFNSTAFADSEEKRENRNRTIQFVNKNGVQAYIDAFVPWLFFDKSSPPVQTVLDIASQTKLQPLIGYLHAMRDRPDRSGLLLKNGIPKILIAGMEDSLVTIQISREMAKMAQNSNFFEMKNTAHMGFFEAKNECQMVTKRFAHEIFLNN